MTPGPELDALVAEKVMGCPPHEHNHVVDEDCGDLRCLDCGLGWRVHETVPDNCIRPYSTDIAAAWSVVEKMANAYDDGDGGSWRREVQVYWKMDGVWEARIENLDRDLQSRVSTSEAQDFYGYGDTAPEAICRAALRAVGVEME